MIIQTYDKDYMDTDVETEDIMDCDGNQHFFFLFLKICRTASEATQNNRILLQFC